MDNRRVLLSPVIILLYTTQMVITAQGADSNNLTQFCQSSQLFAGGNLSCCGNIAYNPIRDTCCNDNITQFISELVSGCCGSVAYNPLNKLCCDSRLHPLEPEVSCCGAEIFSTTTQLCCGPKSNVTAKTSEDDLCCGDESYNPATHCCNQLTVKIQDNGTCPNMRTTNNNTSVYALSSDQGSSKKNICDPYIKIPWQGMVLKRNTETQLLPPGMLWCNGKLHCNVTEGSRCHGVSVYDSKKETVCEYTWHDEPHGQCCGQELFDPRKEMCCKGHRRSRSGELECCGAHAYNVSDPSQKCCSGQIYKGRSGTAQCCGKLLVEDPNTQQCCSSSQLQLLYSKQLGFSCCGHQFYNSSLYSCCEEKLQGRHHHNLSSAAGDIGQCSVHPDLGSVSASLRLCNSSIYIGTLKVTWQDGSERHIEMTSVSSINFNHTRSRYNIKPASNPLMAVVDHCSCPHLDQGREYLWCGTGKNITLFVDSQIRQKSLLSAVMSAFE
ncbi:galaxin-like [Brienomyrus brachyistius]|uniref:galaxin-like n=1 Tax=Brienomyrus brachyistius TaxID=42636 RepID=UPI0020B39E2B|nr:galaxin-like [Brienomyrus brachyistius]